MMKIRYGILSTANVVPRFVAGVKQSKNGEVTAIASRNLTKAQQAAKQLDIPKAYGSYEALCADPEVDVVYIAAYNQGHYPAAKLALNHHKHVLLEKPFTLKLEEAEELFALAAKQQCFLMEAQKAVFLPITQQIKAKLVSGSLGALRWVQSVTSYPNIEGIKWFSSLEAGGGALYGCGNYPIEYLFYLTGQEITQAGGTARFPIVGGSDSQCSLALRFGEDILADIFITTDLDIPSQMTFFCEKGRIEVPNFWKTKTASIIYQDGSKEELSSTFDSEFVFEVEHVNDCLLKQELSSPVMTMGMTLATVDLVEGLYQQWLMD